MAAENLLKSEIKIYIDNNLAATNQINEIDNDPSEKYRRNLIQ